MSYRIVLLPFIASVELVALAVGWTLALVWPKAAARYAERCANIFPSIEWYRKETPK